MLTAINDEELVFLNPSNIVDIKVSGFKKSDEYTYRSKSSLFHSKGVYCLNSFFITKSIEKFLKEHDNNYIVDENNVIYEKPYILITLINKQQYTWHYDSVEKMNEALQDFLNDLRTVGRPVTRINRNSVAGPFSL